MQQIVILSHNFISFRYDYNEAITECCGMELDKIWQILFIVKDSSIDEEPIFFELHVYTFDGNPIVISYNNFCLFNNLRIYFLI